MKYASPCKKHRYKLKKQIEPQPNKNGYSLYICSICGKEYKKIITYKEEY